MRTTRRRKSSAASSSNFNLALANPLQVKHGLFCSSRRCANFREGCAAITHMEFNPSWMLFSVEYAVFEGTLDWTLSLGTGNSATTKAMPFLTVLHVTDGQVIGHRDFADFAPFLAAVRPANEDR